MHRIHSVEMRESRRHLTPLLQETNAALRESETSRSGVVTTTGPEATRGVRGVEKVGILGPDSESSSKLVRHQSASDIVFASFSCHCCRHFKYYHASIYYLNRLCES